EYIVRAGSVEGGLRRYVGAANLPTDGGYVAKVLGEHKLLTLVARNAHAVPDVPKPAVRSRTMQVTQSAQQAGPQQPVQSDKQAVALLN
ncbi:hypothetical protein ACQV5M_20270, partial [Leptospira sp. SA-E8]|uniref:hypothetical protein n=1 Tax=Leptospira sp. SA-E8 TaxID=3422259 RepID=UPI003EB85C09